MAKKKRLKADLTVAQSAEMARLVDESLNDMKHYSKMLADAEDVDEQKLRIKQIYLHNLKAAGEPLAMSQKVLADLMTRVEVNKILGNDVDPLSPAYFKILEEMRKTLKLVKDVEGHKVDFRVSKVNDENMKVVDVEIMEEMFKE